jgi:hypothetical protein
MSDERSLVPLPRAARPPFEVFVNGVPQKEGEDYRVEGCTLSFGRSLQKEGKLGFFRWLSIFLGLVGTYRQHDSVDVHYRVKGEHRVATELDIIPPQSATERD